MVAAVIFDLDGLLLESEQVWTAARERVAREHRGRWSDEAAHAMFGMSSTEWSRHMHDELGVQLEPEAISAEVVRLMGELYARELPLAPGADDAVRRLAARWPLGLASSSNREVIDSVLEASGWSGEFDVTVSSEEVARGKPEPDVYLEAARGLGREPSDCVGIEDSSPGVLSALAAGLAVIAIPNRAFPPEPAVLERAHVVLTSLEQLDADAVEAADRASR